MQMSLSLTIVSDRNRRGENQSHKQETSETGLPASCALPPMWSLSHPDTRRPPRSDTRRWCSRPAPGHVSMSFSGSRSKLHWKRASRRQCCYSIPLSPDDRVDKCRTESLSTRWWPCPPEWFRKDSRRWLASCEWRPWRHRPWCRLVRSSCPPSRVSVRTKMASLVIICAWESVNPKYKSITTYQCLVER